MNWIFRFFGISGTSHSASHFRFDSVVTESVLALFAGPLGGDVAEEPEGFATHFGFRFRFGGAHFRWLRRQPPLTPPTRRLVHLVCPLHLSSPRGGFA